MCCNGRATQEIVPGDAKLLTRSHMDRCGQSAFFMSRSRCHVLDITVNPPPGMAHKVDAADSSCGRRLSFPLKIKRMVDVGAGDFDGHPVAS